MEKMSLVTKILVCAVLALMIGTGYLYAAAPSFGRIECNASTATALYAGGPYRSITFQNQTTSGTAFLAPSISVSTMNAGIILSPSLGTSYTISNGAETWYCKSELGITTIGYTILH